MIITNVDRFPNGKVKINGRPTNEDRKMRSGMLFFNEDGLECGCFIYDGKMTKNGHSAGLSLTYDHYDGDQVIQLLTQDEKDGNNRRNNSGLTFNDRPSSESQLRISEIYKELDELAKKDSKAADEKYKYFESQGFISGSPRMMLGKTRSGTNCLFLLDNKGMPRASFSVDKEKNARLDFYDYKGSVISSFHQKDK
ncbi:hypothetical protein KJS94_01745 [Flavihumibacter rivuli]|uniref:hypothetical protein n=1 Tax=Flavihumibacter rivuli TaxID=2838156 RepID=UPI001BDDF74D|nr:hypothetical protein [Flavihumibacter rivuli]ULQ56920.1 hypothetical protein KJS94_01745 [Flavihumibacter rivuli]